jgi:hypothetical protein
MRKEGESQYIERFKAALAKFTGICSFCRVAGQEEPWHSIIMCPQMTMLPDLSCTAESYRHWSRGITYQPQYHDKICFRCHVPQCSDRLHATFVSRSDQACEYKDALAGIGYAIFHIEPVKAQAQAAFGCTWDNEGNFLDWLNEKPMSGHKTNLSALFLWYSDQP